MEQWWLLLVGAALSIVGGIVGSWLMLLIQDRRNKKGKIDIYYIADSVTHHGSRIVIRLQIKNLTQCDYIMRNIQLVEIDSENKVIKTYEQKRKLEQPIKGLLMSVGKVYGEDGAFSYLIPQRNIEDFTLTYENDCEVQSGMFEDDNGDLQKRKTKFNKISESLAIQYFDELDNLIIIKIKANQFDWEKLKTIER